MQDKQQPKRKPEPIGRHPYVQRHIDGQKKTVSVTDKFDAQTIPYEDIKAPVRPEPSDPGCTTCTGSLHKTYD